MTRIGGSTKNPLVEGVGSIVNLRHHAKEGNADCGDTIETDSKKQLFSPPIPRRCQITGTRDSYYPIDVYKQLSGPGKIR